MKIFYFLLLLLPAFLSISCKKPKGCMDAQAANYDVTAEKDCKCCQYEKVVFYSRYPAYNVGGVLYSILSVPIKIYVNDQEVGTITAYYPNGPGASTVPGVVVYEPQQNKKVEWYAKAVAPNGNFVVLGSGTFTARNSPIAIPIF